MSYSLVYNETGTEQCIRGIVLPQTPEDIGPKMENLCFRRRIAQIGIWAKDYS